MDIHATRIIIYTCAQRRHVKIGEDFCAAILNREFNPTLHPAGYDRIHIPADFDSQKPLKRWFILDLGVVQQLDKEDVLQLPHQVYLASKHDGKL